MPESNIKLIHEFTTLRTLNPIDVVCHGNGKPHIVKIANFSIINGVAHAYCKEHDLFFHVDSKKKPLEESEDASKL